MMPRMLFALLTLGCLVEHLPGQTLEFNRDVRPILSNNCFLCHGPDKAHRKGNLRLDIEQDVYGDRGEGVRVVVPGRPMESELYRRLVTHEAGKKMPPAKSNKTVSDKEISIVKTWIEQGGKYQRHWSLIAPRKAEPPAVKNAAWVRNPIDAFILARLDKEGIHPAAEADRRTLIRRLSFDLVGLPPSPEEVDAFVNDTRADAYERLVDRMLASEHFGERLALHWLDLVRFADTGGYHSDNHRDITLYRDWVIDAFNKNMPFDQFAVEQIAGDLLPAATNSQKIASGYNRLLQTTEEGGAQAKEYAAKYFSDRVRNVSTVWLGLTLGCTECHNHPYDPFTTKEFYQFGAFFADVKEAAVGRQQQTPITTPEQEARLKSLDAEIAKVQQALAGKDPVKAQEAWEKEVQAKGATPLPKEIADLVKIEPAKRNAKQKEAVAGYFRSHAPELKKLQAQLTAAQKRKDAEAKALPHTLVSLSGPARVIRVLPRGNWLDETGEVVTAKTPAALHPLKTASQPNRLDFARWVTDPDNPLTARALVNRLWMLYFGQGISKPLDDLGSQGAWPTHPELLDHLAVEFQAKKWDVKAMVRLLVTSNAYRQSSTANAELRHRDPYNQLVARQGRFRLDAEFVRDNALAVSGLLVHRLGGPSVKPYQPAGYWRYLNFPTREWADDKNENQYRRGLYTYWQRSFLHPSLLAFDAPTREECTVERSRSNTPQQALVLLNDPTYVEASRAFAERIVKSGGDDAGRIQFAFRQALQRPATAEEVRVVDDLRRKNAEHFQANPKEAEAFLRVGLRPMPKGGSAVELAAWTNVARVILNLHETITRN